VFVIKCDGCGTIYELMGLKKYRKFNFHSRECYKQSQSKDGTLYEHLKEQNLAIRGVEFCLQSEEVKEKSRQTMLVKYGVESAMQSQEIRDLRNSNIVEKYGCIHQKVPAIQEKSAQTCLERYGVEHPFMLPKCKEKSNSPEANAKKHQTRKKNGNYGRISNEENDFHEFLLGLKDLIIERDICVNGWSIDFLVNSRVYVQYDGNYYHGLDRPVKQILEFRNDTDRTIYGTMLRDKAQNAWFLERGFSLLRIDGFGETIFHTDEISAQLGTRLIDNNIKQFLLERRHSRKGKP